MLVVWGVAKSTAPKNSLRKDLARMAETRTPRVLGPGTVCSTKTSPCIVVGSVGVVVVVVVAGNGGHHCSGCECGTGSSARDVATELCGGTEPRAGVGNGVRSKNKIRGSYLT